MRRHCNTFRPSMPYIPAAARARRLQILHCTASTARSIPAPAATASRSGARAGHGECVPTFSPRPLGERGRGGGGGGGGGGAGGGGGGVGGCASHRVRRRSARPYYPAPRK